MLKDRVSCLQLDNFLTLPSKPKIYFKQCFERFCFVWVFLVLGFFFHESVMLPGFLYTKLIKLKLTLLASISCSIYRNTSLSLILFCNTIPVS